MPKVAIIGAGLTGLSTAYHLEEKGFFDYEIFEKNDQPGGLARSVHVDGFTFDYTGHFVHINNEYFKNFFENVIGKTGFTKIVRDSQVFTHDKFSPYPFQTNLSGLPTDAICECIEGFVLRQKHLHPVDTFRQWVLKYYGTGIGKYFLFPYNEKISAYDLDKMCPSWVQNFVPSTTLANIVEGLTTEHSKQVGYNAHFWYPKRGGIQLLVDRLQANITQKIKTEFQLSSIDPTQKFVSFKNGDSRSYDMLVSTAPLNNLVDSVKESGNINFSAAKNNLLCNSIFGFNLGINRPFETNAHWVYIPEKKYNFYRLGFWNNVVPAMAPPGCGSLFGEVAYIPSHTSEKIAKQNLRNAIAQTKKLLKIQDSEVLVDHTLQIPHAFVTHNRWREENLKNLHAKLRELNIYSIGRYGEWKYSSMQDAVLDGRATATAILTRLGHVAPAAQVSRIPRPTSRGL